MKILFLMIVYFSNIGNAAPTRVGNGDPGGDLEGVIPITSGKIIKSQKKAVQHLKQINVLGVPGLGALISEVENSKLYLSQADVHATLPEDWAKFHSDFKGLVYARTFAIPHASTRFFPAATKLNDDQLVALHIHEGLHRALPPSLREDESKVSEITLAITAPDSSFDQIKTVMNKFLPNSDQIKTSLASVETPDVPKTVESEIKTIPEEARVRNPSTLGYEYRKFRTPKRESLYPIDSMHFIQSFVYPFGKLENPIGFGIEASFIKRPKQTQMGPLGISGRMRLWSSRGFDVDGWAKVSLNTLSSEEFKNSPLGRDVLSLGLTVSKELNFIYVQNTLGYFAPGSVNQKIALLEVQHEYGGVVFAAIRGGVKIWKMRIGGFTEIYLADYYRMKQEPAFSYDTGRYRLVSAGPEVSFLSNNFAVFATGRFLINSTQDASFDTLGNLMGTGVAQGNLAVPGIGPAGDWARAGGDFNLEECIMGKKEKKSEENKTEPQSLVFDLTSWFLNHLIARQGVNYGWVLISDLSVFVYGETSGGFSPRIRFMEQPSPSVSGTSSPDTGAVLSN